MQETVPSETARREIDKRVNVKQSLFFVSQGDSGSAVMCEYDDDVDNMMSSSSLFPARSRLVLAGVVSYGFDSDCGIPDIPSAHTAVPAYITWIRDVIASTVSGTYGDDTMSSSPNAITTDSVETVTKGRDRRQNH